MTDSERGSRVAARKMMKKRMVDALNHVNFRRESVIVNLEHVRYGNILSLRAFPEACMGEELTCLWADTCPSNIAVSHVFKNLMVDRGLDLLRIGGEAIRVTSKSVTIRLPESCEALQPRKARRYACQQIKADLMQNGSSFSGSLEDFTASSFRVLVSARPPQSFGWIDETTPVYVVLSKEGEMLYSGSCRIVRQTEARRQREFVVEPIRDEVGKAGRDRLGTEGYSIAPLPNVVFDHPLTGKKVRLESDQISPCWFSVIENYDASVLFVGLVVPEIEIEAVPGASVKCRGQVMDGAVREGNGERTVTWRIVVTDTGVESQGRLFAWLQRQSHHKSLSYGTVDLDDLLTFFFETGFVYPQKYAGLQDKRDEFRETYRKLYLDDPAIARHFIQMDRGVIQGHLSMLRFYEGTWILHHHAATGQHRAGLAVLNEARKYVNDCRFLYSSHMDFLICYFRSSNRFPNHVFGGFARSLDNPSHCSIDAFAYLTVENGPSMKGENGKGWLLVESDREDLEELNAFYASSSGGVAMKALDLETEMLGEDSLDKEYERLGFKRKRYIYSLKKDGLVKAVFVATLSDVGLNMSGLTDCIHLFVLDEEDLTAEELLLQVRLLSRHYDARSVPVLLYPVSFADSRSMPYEKEYLLWAFDCRYTDRYYDYMGTIISGKSGGERRQAPSFSGDAGTAASEGREVSIHPGSATRERD